jgi:hypothetical protein
MSHSYRKVPVFGRLAPGHSQKDDKRLANRNFRRQARMALGRPGEGDGLRSPRETSDLWDWFHDGKRYRHDVSPRDMGK